MALDALRCSSSLSLQLIFPLLREAGLPATILNPNIIFSPTHLLLAEALAQKSFADNMAVSPRLEMEFILWLAQTPHANKAIERIGAKKNDDFVLVVLGNEKDDAPNASALAKKLGLIENKNKTIGSLSALSFFGATSEMQLYEKMALSRI